MIETLTRHWRVLLAYIVIGTAVYWTALGAFFVSDDFEWDYFVPCALVAAAPQGELRVRVTAIDSDGQRADLGTRLIKAHR
jgi:hypothetical protein